VQEVPVIVTGQNPRALGKTDDRIDLASLGPLHLATIEKVLFSMETLEVLSSTPQSIFPIACVVLQSTLDFLEHSYDVHVPASGMSSCNNDEAPLALERTRHR
ncbi:hypothetical protein V8E53_015429, partial [Lactarius tabidus]